MLPLQLLEDHIRYFTTIISHISCILRCSPNIVIIAILLVVLPWERTEFHQTTLTSYSSTCYKQKKTTTRYGRGEKMPAFISCKQVEPYSYNTDISAVDRKRLAKKSMTKINGFLLCWSVGRWFWLTINNIIFSSCNISGLRLETKQRQRWWVSRP